jgi:ssRNA-specific RNase YbeY (16S rRNA maturation enzyme)
MLDEEKELQTKINSFNKKIFELKQTQADSDSPTDVLVVCQMIL